MITIIIINKTDNELLFFLRISEMTIYLEV